MAPDRSDPQQPRYAIVPVERCVSQREDAARGPRAGLPPQLDLTELRSRDTLSSSTCFFIYLFIFCFFFIILASARSARREDNGAGI